jgi:predicted dehydrogenase
MDKLRVGVIGMGIGRYHIEGFQNHPNAEVVAIADLDDARRAEAVSKYGVARAYADGEDMLKVEELDVVSVAVPNKFHKALTIAALEQGCHVLTEKPMAMNAAESVEMLEAAKAAGRRLMINFSYRFSTQSMALKSQVDGGILGDVYFARTVWHRRRGIPGLARFQNMPREKARQRSWFSQKALSGGGPLIDLGVHRLDLALWLMGYPQPVWVMGSAYNPIGTEIAADYGMSYDVEDLAAGFIKFDNGASMVIEASWAANIQEKELMETRLLGTKAGLVQRNVDEGYEFEAEIYLENNGAQFDMKLNPPRERAPSAMYHFIDSIVNDEPHIATGEEGLIVMQILDAIYQSADEGRPVEITPHDG